MKFIILGAGDVGMSLSERLTESQHDVVLIEKDEHAINRIPNYLDLQVLQGNGCAPEVLLKAGLNTADYLIAVADIDEVNVAACLAAKLVNPAVKRIARLREIDLSHLEVPQSELDSYFDLIINPDQVGAAYLYHLFNFPGARDVVEFAEGKLRVVALKIAADSPYANARISSLKEGKNKSPVLIIAIIRDEKLIVPSGSDRIRPNDIVYIISEPRNTAALFRLAGHRLQAPKSAMIWGGTALARFLTHSLEETCTNVKLILKETEIHHDVVDEFASVLLLQGSGTDQNLLLEENVQSFDAFIAASPSQEDNILAALLAKKLGVTTSMAVVQSSTYLTLVAAIGVDVVTSTQMAAASAIFRHIHSEAIVSDFSLGQNAASFIELSVRDDFPLRDKQIKDLRLPHGLLVASIVRGEEVIIPSGEDFIRQDDELIFFVLKSASRKLEKFIGMEIDL